ncbi:MAG: phosphoribosylamine--glycine ligase [Acidobacteria bacterium]|nr:MAG: phosphoribosylamine--glycine ligase [Acidobacteriota bacterium]REK01287.1 MAG: phosphoribosylamine--glycine ligase [Acidobacteriota bacterium]REK14243.1 MAG: phosphoribosylamine--glycine ligase [Acidobacteriota bacterium]REK44958.1 MAG: phosphoribosylamine--glycine ligase [Acidobacteriota bacterium]
MRILVVGSGGREHAIAWAFSKSPRTTKLYCAKGNAGIAEIAETVDIGPEDILALAEFAQEKKIDLTFVGPENSLAAGIVDEFQSRGLRIVGAGKDAARLEASKSFAKEFMSRHSIPTAAFAVADSAEEAVSFLESGRFGGESAPVVVKADGLAAGKGVVVCRSRSEAVEAVRSLTEGEIVSADAARTIVLEECLVGKEISVILFADGKNFALMPPARDHKRIGEGDTGPNTGGMGVVSDPSLLSADQRDMIIEEIIRPTIEGSSEEGFPFSGILFVGLMMTESGPKVLEYNVRFGDPETQAILVNLETDLVDISEAMIEGSLDRQIISWKEGSAACVILAAENYPAQPRTGDRIEGLDEAGKHECVEIFHAGTAHDDHKEVVTSGGRVLAVTATASNLSNALHRAYKAVNELSWPGMQYRSDIGK